MPAFGARSRAHLADCHPDLIRLHEAVVKIFDHQITDGKRTLAEQVKNVERGVSKTLDSKHLPQADGLAHATDSTPYPPPDWDAVTRALDAVRRVDPNLDLLRFYYMQGAILGVASQLGISIRQGIDWDGDRQVRQNFVDLPHNELR